MLQFLSLGNNGCVNIFTWLFLSSFSLMFHIIELTCFYSRLVLIFSVAVQLSLFIVNGPACSRALLWYI